jgi:ubiquinone/menaquinone biosynthesis C-methylase UbiE
VSFDRLAPVYRLMEMLLAGKKLQRCRIAHLPKLNSTRKALLLGEGHGRFLVPLLQANPSVRVTCLDSSAGMLEECRQSVQGAGLDSSRVQYILEDVLAWQPQEGGFDLISTHFLLDCFTAAQLEVLLPKLTALAASNACWVVSDFCAPDRGLARLRARLILWSMYRFFRVVTRLPASQLVEYTGDLQRLDFRLERRDVFEWGLLRADLWRREVPLS